MEWAQILVIILSVFLALFLLLSMILVVLLIRVTKQIKTVTSVAERTAVKFEKTASNIAAVTSPIAIAKLITSFFKNKKK
ncbi:hypothetical protein HG445_000220 [Candidatus Saccharibacteria bacterium]|nr:hypothetical protein [Candidatus Saccharibacteria bacterium]